MSSAGYHEEKAYERKDGKEKEDIWNYIEQVKQIRLEERGKGVSYSTNKSLALKYE